MKDYLETQMGDGRKMGLFKATAEANRRGMSRNESIKVLAEKAITVDGLDRKTADTQMNPNFLC